MLGSRSILSVMAINILNFTYLRHKSHKFQLNRIKNILKGYSKTIMYQSQGAYQMNSPQAYWPSGLYKFDMALGLVHNC